MGPNAEFSVDDPIANSSIFVLPKITIPAAFNLLTTVESYGGFQPSKILEPQVVGTSFCTITSFKASGTPASGDNFSPARRFLSTNSACAKAPALSKYKKAFISLSVEAICW